MDMDIKEARMEAQGVIAKRDSVAVSSPDPMFRNTMRVTGYCQEREPNKTLYRSGE